MFTWSIFDKNNYKIEHTQQELFYKSQWDKPGNGNGEGEG